MGRRQQQWPEQGRGRGVEGRPRRGSGSAAYHFLALHLAVGCLVVVRGLDGVLAAQGGG